jgi:hypothetical protein
MVFHRTLFAVLGAALVGASVPCGAAAQRPRPPQPDSTAQPAVPLDFHD